MHEIDERAVRLREEEVDVGRPAGDERQRVAVHERDDEVHPEGPRRRCELVEDGLERRRRQEERGIHGVSAGPGHRERQCRADGDAAHRRELDRQVAVEQAGESTGHVPTLRSRACRARTRCAGLSRRGSGATSSRLRPVGGGDLNDAYAATLADGSEVFVKTRDGAAPGEFASEAEGLRWLASAGALRVAELLAVGDDWLALRWIERGRLDAAGEEELGRGLAALHRAGAPSFGGSRPLRLGPLELPNDPSERVAVVLCGAAPGAARGPGRSGGRRRRGCARGSTRSPARRSLRRDCTATSGAATCSRARTAGRGSSIRRPTAGTARSISRCSRCSARRRRGRWRPTTRCGPGRTDTRSASPLYQLFPLLVHAVLFGGGYVASAEAAARRYV